MGFITAAVVPGYAICGNGMGHLSGARCAASRSLWIVLMMLLRGDGACRRPLVI